MLVLAASDSSPDRDEMRRLIAEDLLPDAPFEDALNATSLGERELRQVGGLRGHLLQRLPIPVALAIEVWARRHDYDVVLSWCEPLAFPLAALLSLPSRRRLGHIAILLRPFDTSSASPAKRFVKQVLAPLLARHGMDRLWVPAPLQRQFVIDRWGIPAERIVPVGWSVDTRFWRPMPAVQDMICSAGREMRDYATLIAALQTLEIRCHIAAGTGVLNIAFGTEDPRATNVAGKPLPASVTIGYKSPAELRELYARSRMVVVPILPSQSDNGVTTVLEAMAMGRAVISTDTDGRPDILEDGVNCVLVPPGDPTALRAAIEELWRDPARCARLGAEGRKHVEQANGIDQWLTGIRAAAAEFGSTSPNR